MLTGQQLFQNEKENHVGQINRRQKQRRIIELYIRLGCSKKWKPENIQSAGIVNYAVGCIEHESD